MKKVLIISRQQFGYLIDIYKWCQYIGKDYSVDVITLGGRPKVPFAEPNVRVHYVSDRGCRTIRGIRFILVCLWHMLNYKGNIIVEFFHGCSIFKRVYPRKRMILDVRTLSVSDNEEIRKKDDGLLKQYTEIFDFVTIISEGIQKKLGLGKEKSAILPLGADIISETSKNFENLSLLYVGTLTGRQIDKTVRGLAMFIERNPLVPVHYNIVGDGQGNELQELKTLAKELGLVDYMTFYGYKLHNDIKFLFNECNVGISFVPITPHYDHQPPTKSYEYVLSGLYTIATGTYCNKQIITEENGMIIKDNEEEFCFALENVVKKRERLDSKEIRQSLQGSLWKNIVKDSLQTLLDSLDGK